MPDHFHLLLTPLGILLENAPQFIKGGFSYPAKKELGSKIQLWERGYMDHRIRDCDDYANHVAYIYANPVQARMVRAPEEYPYWSAHRGLDVGPCPQGLKPGPWLLSNRHG